MKEYIDEETDFETSTCKIHALIKGQFSHSLIVVLKKEDECDKKDYSQDSLWLMKALKKFA